MTKRMLCCLLALVMCLGVLPDTIHAEEADAYEAYQNAIQATVGSGSWQEDLTITADMIIRGDGAKTKMTVTSHSTLDISGYFPEDMSNLRISGSADMRLMGQYYAWDIIYENGVSHYTYKEPVQKTEKVKTEPGCFRFDSITQDMLVDAQVAGNQITFTIPGDKMETVGNAATGMINGVKNAECGDIGVKIVTNAVTGAMDTLEMTFHASLQLQGYQAEVDYTMAYRFSGQTVEPQEPETNVPGEAPEEIEIPDGLVVYADHKNLSIRKGGAITLSVGMVVDGEPAGNGERITFWVEDESVLRIVDTGIQDNRRYVKCEALEKGTTVVVFTDSGTGDTAKAAVTVYEDNFLCYTLNSVPTEYIDKYPTNIYNANGLYMDSYTYTVNDDKTAAVSFDIYNTNYTYGFVEVYNAKGEMQSAVLINKMHSYSTSIKEALWDNTCCLVRDLIDKDFLSYRQESGHSMKTHVDVVIPAGGYIRITNDPEDSILVNVVNSVDVLMRLGALANSVKNYDVNSQAFAEKLTLKLVEEAAYAAMIRDGSKLPKEIWKNVAKEVAFSPTSLGNFCDTVAKNLMELDLGSLIAETSTDFGWAVGQEIFTSFAGPVKMVLEGLFALGKLENIIIQHTDLINSSGVGAACIQNQGGGIRSSQQIVVESDQGFPDDMALNVFQATVDSDILELLKDINPEVYQAIKNGLSYTYNISLLKKGVETQPDGEVKVHIPIPSDLTVLAYTGRVNIYRVGEDGTLTEMEVDIEDGCFVFYTSHFSLYTVVGKTVSVTVVIGLAVAAIGGIAVVVILVKRRKRKTRSNPS